MGDHGEKLFTSAIQYADFVWLAARTDPEAPKHRGLSVFLVPTDTPGFSWTPLRTIAGEFTSATYYDGVRIPLANLIGDENGGWAIITNQLNLERVAISPASGILRSIEEVRVWAASQPLPDGRRVIDQQWVQIALARLWARADALKLFNWKVGVGGRQRIAAGGCLGHEGLRERIRPRGLPDAGRDRGPGRVSRRGVAGSSAPTADWSAKAGLTPSSPSEAAPTRSSAI